MKINWNEIKHPWESLHTTVLQSCTYLGVGVGFLWAVWEPYLARSLWWLLGVVLFLFAFYQCSKNEKLKREIVTAKLLLGVAIGSVLVSFAGLHVIRAFKMLLLFSGAILLYPTLFVNRKDYDLFWKELFTLEGFLKQEVRFSDKIEHFVLYFGITLILLPFIGLWALLAAFAIKFAINLSYEVFIDGFCLWEKLLGGSGGHMGCDGAGLVDLIVGVFGSLLALIWWWFVRV
jgi:hypothetical protein